MTKNGLYSQKRFCCEDPSLIENYYAAMEDTQQIWHLHHRAEVLPCGNFSVSDLKKFGLYFNRPASELIYLTKAEHSKLHSTHMTRLHRKRLSTAAKEVGGHSHTLETRLKMSKTRKGMKFSDEHRQKMSKSLKGRIISQDTREKIAATLRGKLYWNNGVVNKCSRECPGPEWKRGRIKVK